MIAEYSRLGFSQSACSLSSVYGIMSAVNGLVAIVSGVVAQALVGWSGTEKAPFVASMAFLVFAFGLISEFWVSLSRVLEILLTVREGRKSRIVGTH